jgi:hypothetical protein
MESIGEDFYCQKQIGMVLTRRQELPRKMAPIKSKRRRRRRRSEEKRDLGKTAASDVTGSKGSGGSQILRYHLGRRGSST